MRPFCWHHHELDLGTLLHFALTQESGYREVESGVGSGFFRVGVAGGSSSELSIDEFANPPSSNDGMLKSNNITDIALVYIMFVVKMW